MNVWLLSISLLFILTIVFIFLYAVSQNELFTIVACFIICIIAIGVGFTMYYHGGFSNSYVSPYRYILQNKELLPIENIEYIDAIAPASYIGYKEDQYSMNVENIVKQYKSLLNDAISSLIEYKEGVEYVLGIVWQTNDTLELAQYQFSINVIQFLLFCEKYDTIISQNIDVFLSAFEDVKYDIVANQLAQNVYEFTLKNNNDDTMTIDIYTVFGIYVQFLQYYREEALAMIGKQNCNKQLPISLHLSPS